MPFSLVVKIRDGVVLPARVGSMSVSSNEFVDPPHSTAAQWNTAVWIKQSVYPAANNKGTSYIYGHACRHHVCPFTRLYEAGVGDLVVVNTGAKKLTYRIDRIGTSSKFASALPSWAADSTVPDRIVLVTCEILSNDVSANNIVVVARLL